jgi:GAF domain-containing protein
MAEDLAIVKGNKTEQYESLLPQIRGLVEGESDLVANLANISGALKEQFNWWWIGFYLVKGEELVLVESLNDNGDWIDAIVEIIR